MQAHEKEWLNACPGIIKWKAQRKKNYLHFVLMIGIVIAFFLFILIFGDIQSYQWQEIAFCIAALALFAFVGIRMFKAYLQFDQKQIDQYWMGSIVSMRVQAKSGRKNRVYYIKALVDEKEMEGKCSMETYRKAKLGDSVILFTMKSEGMYIYCVLENE